MEEWRRHYNEGRPHSALGWVTPAEFALRCVLTPTTKDSEEPEISGSEQDWYWVRLMLTGILTDYRPQISLGLSLLRATSTELTSVQARQTLARPGSTKSVVTASYARCSCDQLIQRWYENGFERRLLRNRLFAYSNHSIGRVEKSHMPSRVDHVELGSLS